MINLRQIAIMIGTGVAVAGVLVFSEQLTQGDRVPASFEPGTKVVEAEARRDEPTQRFVPTPVEAAALSERKPAAAEVASPQVLAETEPKRAAGVSAEVVRAIPGPTPALPAEPSFPVAAAEPDAGLFSRHSDLTFAPEASFSRVNGSGVSNSSTARLLSNMNLGGDLSWRQYWSEKLSTRIGLGFSRVDFQGAPNSKVIEQRGKIFGRIGLGADYRFGDRWEAGAGLGIRQEIFYVATGATSLRVDQVAVLRAEVSVKYDLVRLSPFRLGLGARSAYLFPTSADGYSVKAGSSHRFSLRMKEESNGGRLEPSGEVFYDWKKQDTNLNRKTETELGLQFGFTWKFEP